MQVSSSVSLSLGGSWMQEGRSSMSATHVDIILEQLVRRLVVCQDVVVGPRAGERCAKQESEQSVPAEH